MRPLAPPAPSTVTFFHTLPSKVASFKSPLLVSVYAIAGLPLNVALATDFPSAALSRTVLFQPACGMVTLVVTASDRPRVFFATIENVYEVPFFNPLTMTGLDKALFSTPVLRFLMMYSLTCAVRKFTGGSNVISADESAVKA